MAEKKATTKPRKSVAEKKIDGTTHESGSNPALQEVERGGAEPQPMPEVPNSRYG